MNKLYLGIYSCTYAHVTAIHEKKKGYKLEKEQGGIEERVWREEWEGRNDWIMISTKGKKFIKKMQKKSLI